VAPETEVKALVQWRRRSTRATLKRVAPRGAVMRCTGVSTQSVEAARCGGCRGLAAARTTAAWLQLAAGAAAILLSFISQGCRRRGWASGSGWRACIIWGAVTVARCWDAGPLLCLHLRCSLPLFLSCL